MNDAVSDEPTKESDELYTGKPSNNGEYIHIKRVDLLKEIEKAILRTTQSKFEVLDVYIGVSSPPADPEARLVVIYDCNAINQDSDTSSIESQFVSWFPSSRRTSNCYCNFDDDVNWSQFRQEQQPEFRTLLTDFFDSACVDLINAYSDVVAVFPSVYRVLNEGPFDPVLCIVKKSLRFHPYGEDPIPLDDKKGGLFVTLRSGKQVKVVFKEGWVPTQLLDKNSNCTTATTSATVNPRLVKSSVSYSMGDGISLVGLDESYGTVGGFVKKDDMIYAVTNGHVIVKAVKDRKIKTFMDQALNFVIPSIRSQQRKLQHDTKNQYTANTADCGDFFSFLMKEHGNSSLKQILSTHNSPSTNTNTSTSITLTEVRDFLYSSQRNIFTTSFEDILFLDANVQASITSVPGITISGYLALIPMPNSLQISGNTIKMLSLDDMIKHWHCDSENLKVRKVGASTGLTSGEITRPVSVSCPIPSDELFDAKYVSNKPFHRTLLNQIIVRGFHFGDSGDSGSLVYFDPSIPSMPSSTIYGIGTFVGKFDKANSLYLITPSCDFFINGGYDFVRTSLYHR